jgi:diketogulonate reductase-like aldo/keto reductase
MTSQEIIETLKTLRDGALLNIETAYLYEYQMAINDAIDALEKQIPKKSLFITKQICVRRAGITTDWIAKERC